MGEKSMRFADLTKLGLESPEGADPHGFAWAYLESQCPRFTFCGFQNGPGAVIESRELKNGRFLILETPCFIDGLEEVFMGEVVTAIEDRPGRLQITGIQKPMRFAHFHVAFSPKGTQLHELVTGLGGEWESILNGHINFIHIPLEMVEQFEAMADVSLERLS